MDFGLAVNICSWILLINIFICLLQTFTRGQKQRGDPQDESFISPDPERIFSNVFRTSYLCFASYEALNETPLKNFGRNEDFEVLR